MAKTKTEIEKFDGEQLAALINVQEKIEEERKGRSVKLTAHKFPKQLQTHSQGISRGERKAFKKETELETRNYYEFDEEQKDQLLDFLLETRGITESDDISEGELFMWSELIIGRTLSPLMYEGK